MKTPDVDFQVERHSGIDCVLVTCAMASSEVATRVEASTGLSFPQAPCSSAHANGYRVLWLSPRSWLVQCPTGMGAALCSRVEAEFPDHCGHAAPYGDHLVWFELTGSHVRDVLCTGGFVSLEPRGLPVGRVKRTSIAGIAAIVLRPDLRSWLLGIERSLATYTGDWLQDTAERLARVGPLSAQAAERSRPAPAAGR